MKKGLFVFLVLTSLGTYAQERSNLFLSAELNKTKGFSAVYNRTLFKSNFGAGVGIEFIDISTQKLGGIMPSVDLRYYFRAGKSTFIPLAQVGYNFWKVSTDHFDTKGGPGFSLGLGYSYPLNKKASGLYTAIRYRSLQYNSDHPLLPSRSVSRDLKFSIGWRF